MFAFIRYLIAAIILLSYSYYKTKIIIPRLYFRGWFGILLVSIFGVILYNILFLKAEAMISGNTVAVLFAFTPCLTTLLSSLFFKLKIPTPGLIGIIIALIGAVCEIGYATPACQNYYCHTLFKEPDQGELMGILATVAFSFYSIANKYTSFQKVSSLNINTFSAIFGTIILGIYTFNGNKFLDLFHQNYHFWWVMAYTAILATVVAYIWFTDAIIHLGVFKTVVFQNTLPILVVMIGYVFYHKTITHGEIFCAMVVITGVYITNFALNYKK